MHLTTDNVNDAVIPFSWHYSETESFGSEYNAVLCSRIVIRDLLRGAKRNAFIIHITHKQTEPQYRPWPFHWQITSYAFYTS